MTHQPQGEHTARRASGEWFWRFVAAALFFLLCWVAWVAYQISPSALATPAAFQAATRALEVQNVKTGTIRHAAPAAPAMAVAASAAPEKLHPVNMEKLRLSDTLALPAGEK
jgi:hypothetical protein